MRPFNHIINLLLLVIVFTSCGKEDDPHARWEVIDLNYTGGLEDIFILPNDTIMLISRYDASYQKTCIFESDDAGKSWKQNCFDLLTSSGFANLYCFNHLNIMCGNYRTFNGGNSWQQVGFNGAPMQFFNNMEGLYVSGSSIYKTNDGGLTAELVFDRTSYEGFHFMQFVDNEIGYASGGTSWDSYNSGIMVKTTDGGNTWKPLFAKQKSIIGMSFVSADIGYIVIDLHEGNVIETFKTGAELLKTNDGGKTWKSITNKINEEYNVMPYQCYFADEKHGFLCGAGYENKILSTSNGGRTWKVEYSNPSSDYILSKMIFTSSNKGFAVGANGLLLKRITY